MENGQLTILNLDAETAWVSTQINLRDVDWSPAGDRLLVHDENLVDTYFYHQDGRLLHNETTGWVSWGQTDNHIRAGSYLWNENNSASVYISHLPTGAVAQISFTDGTLPKEWPLDVYGCPYSTFVLDWVPQMEWVLLGCGHGGVATNMVLGYRLMALNVRTGEIVDSGLFTPGIEQIDWHPLEPGLLITTDIHGADVSGLGAIVTWQVLENRVVYPSVSTRLVRSPVWSPDGRYIVYTAYDLSGNTQLMVLDVETGTAATRAENGTWPAWSRDNSTIFYLETVPGSESAMIRAVGREQGEPLTVAVGRPPRCPGLCQPRTVFDYTP
jgi:dipeptidyl aminopeptidase/acylaminoacyl peptidase